MSAIEWGRWLFSLAGRRLPAGAPSVRRRLRRDQAWSCGGRAARTTVTCTAGLLWLTQAGEPADVLLAPCESFTCRANGKVVVTALEDAAFTVRP